MSGYLFEVKSFKRSKIGIFPMSTLLLALLIPITAFAQIKPARESERVLTRTTVGDADYTVLAGDRMVAVTASLTAPRTFTLPSAAAYPRGWTLVIVDEAGGVTSTNTLTIARAGSDTINGATSVVIKAANGGIALESDSTSKWTMVFNTLTAAQSAATHQFFNAYNADGTFSSAQPAFTDLSGTAAVAQGGTGLTSGTSGGVLAYTASGTLASSGALTANLPVIGGGAGAAPSVGTRSGNTTAFVTTTGTQTSGDCVKIDANGNHIAAGSPCGSSGGTLDGTRVFNSTNVTLTTGVDAAIPFDTEIYDNGGLHSTTTNTTRITAVTAGYYLITGNAQFDNSAVGYRYLYFKLNGTTTIAVDTAGINSGNAFSLTVTTLYHLGVGDYVEMFALQSSGGNLNILSGSAYTPTFAVQLITPG